MNQDNLIIRLRKGDSMAFDLLYEKYWKKLFSIAYRRTDDEDTAKDIVQEVFVSVWKKREKLQIETELEFFLIGAVKLQVLKYFRSETVKMKVLQYGMEKMKEAICHMNELFPYYALESILEKEVNALPDNMKQAFLLKSDNYSIKEIAAALNIAEQTVSNNLSEAMKRIRQKIAAKYPGNYLSSLIVVLSLLHKQ